MLSSGKVRIRGIAKLIPFIAMAMFLLGAPSKEVQAAEVTYPNVMVYGSSGENVVALQTELASRGLYDYKIDGLYGSITKQGVQDFQKENLFRVDGQAGPETLSGMPNVKGNLVTVKEVTKPVVAQKQAQPKAKAKVVQATGNTMTVNASAYTAGCHGCSGITADGTDVRGTIYHPSGHRVVATDPNVIPMGTLVKINGTTYIAADKGGAIKGPKIDILVGSKNEAINFGRKSITIEILK